MSAEETTPAVDAPAAPAPASEEAPAAPASAAAAAAPNTRPSSRAAAKPASSDPKKKVARPSTGGGSGAGAKKASASFGSGAKKAAPDPSRTYNHGDIVLARLKGFPPWPARIADPETVSIHVKRAKPPKSTNLYAVEFFPAGDYSWLPSREIQPLSPKDITDFLKSGNKKGKGDMHSGYEVARDPAKWDAEQAELRQDRDAALEEEDELEDEEAEDDNEMSGGKRKKATKEKSKTKKPKTAKKNGISKAEVEEEEEPKPKSKAVKGKTEKSKAATASKPENQAAVDDDPLAQNPECIKVKDWRHKLQRAFLGKSLPTSDEMSTYDSLFKTIEEYKDITVDALTYSKIGKVMKKIATLSEIPRNDELKITDRASTLMKNWSTIIAGNGTEANGDGAKATETKAEGEGAEPKQSTEDPAVNGTGAGEGEGEKTETADTKMDVEPTPAS